jgi:hypothetical protein
LVLKRCEGNDTNILEVNSPFQNLMAENMELREMIYETNKELSGIKKQLSGDNESDNPNAQPE